MTSRLRALLGCAALLLASAFGTAGVASAQSITLVGCQSLSGPVVSGNNIIITCNNTGAQVWIPQSNGSLYNPQANKCLDDTAWSTTPGTQVEIWDCTGGGNQKWVLPS